MNEDERKMMAIGAHLEGESALARNCGKKHKISDMELFALCNLAHLGCLSVYSELDGDIGLRAKAERDRFLDTIRSSLTDDGSGISRLVQCGVAILGQERLGQYVLREDERETGE